MSNDYTQDFIDEVKGCLDGGGISEEVLDDTLEDYSKRAFPIHTFPTCTSSITLMSNSIFPRMDTLDYRPFNIPTDQSADDSDSRKNSILSGLRSFFDVNVFRNMYRNILEHNGLADADRLQLLQNADLVDLIHEFLRLEMRSTDPLGYSTMYTLQRLPKIAGGADPLVHNFKLSWLGSDAKVYYTILTVTMTSRPANFANQIEATDIAAEGLTADTPVYIAIDDEMNMDSSGIAEHVRMNTQAVFEAVYEAFNFTDALEFAKNVREFNVQFVYNAVEGGSYGVTHVRNVYFERRHLYIDKQDQWVPWPMFYDFAYRGEIEDDNYTTVMDVTYSHEQPSVSDTTTAYDCRIGHSSDITWD